MLARIPFHIFKSFTSTDGSCAIKMCRLSTIIIMFIYLYYHSYHYYHDHYYKSLSLSLFSYIPSSLIFLFALIQYHFILITIVLSLILVIISIIIFVIIIIIIIILTIINIIVIHISIIIIVMTGSYLQSLLLVQHRAMVIDSPSDTNRKHRDRRIPSQTVKSVATWRKGLFLAPGRQDVAEQILGQRHHARKVRGKKHKGNHRLSRPSRSNTQKEQIRAFKPTNCEHPWHKIANVLSRCWQGRLVRCCPEALIIDHVSQGRARSEVLVMLFACRTSISGSPPRADRTHTHTRSLLRAPTLVFRASLTSWVCVVKAFVFDPVFFFFFLPLSESF